MSKPFKVGPLAEMDHMEMTRRLRQIARGVERGWKKEKAMNPKLKAFLRGAAEAAGAGIVIGVLSVWTQPTDVVLTGPGLALAGTTGLKFGLVYLFAFLRMNVAFRPVWTDEKRAALNGK